ncbi:MAG: dockerin type I domain-containing protein [Candidatus Poribacteria bacterium]
MRFIGAAIIIIILCLNYTIESAGYQYYPNFIGNTWILKHADAEDRVVKVDRTTVIGGREVNVLERHTPGGIDEMYIFTEPDGIKVVRSVVNLGGFALSLDYDTPEVFIPAFLGVGMSWTIKGETTVLGFSVKVNAIATVVAQEDVMTPAGTFRSCFKIRQDYVVKAALPFLNIPSLITYMWLAPNIGLVKEMDSKQVVFELVDYKLFYPWDVNHDLEVDVVDLAEIGAHFGEFFHDIAADNPDVNRDGIVDISDLVLVGKHRGEIYLPGR